MNITITLTAEEAEEVKSAMYASASEGMTSYKPARAIEGGPYANS